jgi:hypothetical protein
MSSHGQSGEQKLIAGFFLGPSSFFRITPDKSLGPYRERAGGQRPANRKNARGRSVHDTATCTKPPRGLAGQLPYGDSIDRVCLAILTRRWASPLGSIRFRRITARAGGQESGQWTATPGLPTRSRTENLGFFVLRTVTVARRTT